MSNVLKNYVFNKLENLLDEFIGNLYDEFGIKTGDVTPLQAHFFEKTERELASMICEFMEQNCPEDFSDECNSEPDVSEMSIDALLRGFIKKEAEFRLRDWFELPEKQLTEELVKDVAEELYKEWDVINMDMMDKIIYDTLAKKNVQY